MIKTEFKIDKRFKKNLQLKFENFAATVGVIQDAPYRSPKYKTKKIRSIHTSVDGMKVRKKSGKTRGTVKQVFKHLRKEVDILRLPFTRTRTNEYKMFLAALRNAIGGKNSALSELRTMLVQLIRTPLRKKRYKRNQLSTSKAKGFNRFGVDTAQTYKAISASIKRKR